MANLYIMAGLPASGKSTFTKLYCKSKTMIVVSSDEIRECLYGDPNEQGDPNEVFAYVDSITYDTLKYGIDVIYDATSLTKAIRENIIKKFEDVTESIHLIWMNTPFEECLSRNFTRDRHVPYDVMVSMNERLEMPTKDERFTTISIITNEDCTYIEPYEEIEIIED